jgi:hypothetical protein
MTREEMEGAIKRIALTNDGQLLSLWLQDVLMTTPNDQSDGALQRDFGRRKFAAELKGLMDQALAEYRKNASGSDTGIERLVVHAGRLASSGDRRSRRRVE